MAKTFTWPKDTAKHTISYAQHQKNVKKAGGGTAAAPTGGSGATLTTERVTARARKDPDFLKRARKNAGLRALLAPDLLSSSQQAERTLNAPVVPGGSLTGRQLRSQGAAETQVKYGGQEADLAQSLKEQQTRQQQISGPGGWYDQYLAQVQGNAANVGAINDRAQAQIAATGQMQGDLGAQTLQSVTQGQLAATGAPPPAGTTLPSDIATTAAQATAARQQMAGILAAQQAGIGANANAYAQNFAGLVAPQQKLEAGLGQARNVDKVRAQQQALKGEEGAFKEKYRADTTQQEFANAIAKATLNLQGTKAAADIAANSPVAKAKAAATTAGLGVDADNAKVAGLSLKAYQSLTPAQQQQAVVEGQKRTHARAAGKGEQRITSGAFIGLKPSQVAGLSEAEKLRRLKAYTGATTKPAKGAKPTDQATAYAKDFFVKYGVKPVSTEGVNTAKRSISQASTWIGRIRQSNPGMSLVKIGQLLSTGQAADKKGGSPAIPKMDPLFVRTAMDLSQGGVSAGTANRLHHAGYSTKLLGVKSRAAPKADTRKPFARELAGAVKTKPLQRVK